MWDINTIKEQVKSVISYSQNIEEPEVNALIDKWLDAKRDFIEVMNGELIYEYPSKVSLSLDERERNIRVDDFISILDTRWGNADLANFVEDMRDGFFNNLMPRDYEYNGKIIKKGMKMIKAFKFFETDKCALTDIQNYASRIIQEDKIEGIFCLSVHPLDYLSSSETTHNWRSCHALDGEFRSGNLSYMMDKSTVICYLKSDKDEVLPNFPFAWNSKKWRMLLYFSQDWRMLMAGRQYPFATTTGLNFITNNLLPAIGFNSDRTSWTEWHGELLKDLAFEYGEGTFTFNDPYIPIGNELIKLCDLVTDLPDSMQFNDLLKSSCYTPLYAYRLLNNTWWGTLSHPTGQSKYDTTRFYIGGGAPCIYCGERTIEVNESMLCHQCEINHGTLNTDEYGYCLCCGRHVYLEDAHWVDDEVVCDNCFETSVSQCECCGQEVFNSEITFDREAEKYICSWCRENHN